MSEEQSPNVDEIKERLKIEIPVEEEDVKKAETEVDITAELRNLGRQVAETVRTVWGSEERHKLEKEIREGVSVFVTEVDKAIREVRVSPATQRAKAEVVEAKTRVETGELGQKARRGVSQGLQWLSEELGKLAEQFSTPVDEREPEAPEKDAS